LTKTEIGGMSYHSPDRTRVAQLAREEKRKENGLETFCTQHETGIGFFYFFARNPLKSPDSDE
jgi:hypothetical protein